MMLLGGLFGSPAMALPGKDVATSAPSPLQQATAAYDARDFARALDLARQAARTEGTRDRAQPLQIWIRSAEELGDLGAMAEGIELYAKIPDLGEGSARFIDAARLRYSFYEAERAGRITEAEIALKSAKERSAGSPAWQESASGRLIARRAMVGRDYTKAREVADALGTFPGSAVWLATLYAELDAAQALTHCNFDGISKALATVEGLPLMEVELLRLDREGARANVRQKVNAKDLPGARATLTGLEALPDPTAADLNWAELYRLRIDLDEAWDAGRKDEVLAVRDHFRSLLARVPGEPECIEPEWLKPDIVDGTGTDTGEHQRRVSRGLFLAAGGSALAAGVTSGLTLLSVADYQQQRGAMEVYDEQTWSDGPGARAAQSRATSLTSAALGLASASLLTAGIIVRW